MPQEGKEVDATQNKTKGECMINSKSNVIIEENIGITPMNINVSLTIWKDKPTMLKRNIMNNPPSFHFFYR